MGRPATGKTPTRGIRVPTDLWEAARAKAAAEGTTITEVLIRYLTRYVATPPKERRPPRP